MPTVAQHRHVIAQPVQLIQPVTDVDRGDASLAQPRDQRKEPFGFRRRQAAGRLIEDDEPRAATDGFRNLKQLLFADAQRPDGPVEIDRGADLAETFGRQPAHPHAIDQPRSAQATRRGRGSRRPTGSRRTRVPDAPSPTPARTASDGLRNLTGVPSIAMTAAIGRHASGEDLPQRAFAGAILPAQARGSGRAESQTRRRRARRLLDTAA